MKESHLIEKNLTTSLLKTTTPSQQKTFSNISLQNELLDGVFKTMEFLIYAEERIQIYKEMLTERNDFSPEPLYYYVSREEEQLDKRHLIMLFEENHVTVSEDFVKLYFNSYGYKDRLDYSAFINLVFPENTDLIKYISVTGIKKYSNQTLLSEEILCIFMMLVQEEIRLLEGLDSLKSELIPRITRKDIKNIMRTMKRNSQCNSLMEIQSQPFVKYEQLKTLFKKFVTRGSKAANKEIKKSDRSIGEVKHQDDDEKIELYSLLQKNSLSVFRKLSMGKTNFINQQDFEFWFRPWSKLKTTQNSNEELGNCSSNIFNISGINEVDDQSKVSLGEDPSIPLCHTCC